MTLDWQVLGIAFMAIWLRFLAVGTDLDDLELEDELKSPVRDFHQPQGEAGVPTR